MKGQYINEFVNPYHFVSLGDKCLRFNPEERKNEQKYSGWIEVQLTNKTPIFIPNSSNDAVFNHIKNGKSYEFFSYENLSNTHKKDTDPPPENPVIPGSELRGVIRSTYEALTLSCLSSLNKDKTISRRTVPFRNTGILKKENGQWVLIKCKTEKIYKLYKPEDYAKKLKVDNKRYEGYLFVGEEGIKGRSYRLFIKPEKEKKLHVPEEAVENFFHILDDYADSSKNTRMKEGKHSGYKFLGKNRDLYLVFYEKDDKTGKLYLSPAQIGREAYYNKLRDILKQQGGFQPCDNKTNLCRACMLFGFVAENIKNESIGGKVRFTDLFYTSDKPPSFNGPLYLKELASPKITAVEFYLRRPPNAHYWNYDYAIKWEKGSLNREYLEYQPKIMGRKFYWHNLNPSYEEKSEITERNTKIRPLKEGHTFKGKIFFENLTEEELITLLFVINLNKDNVERYGHKIGMGKPLGLGTVVLKTTQMMIRTLIYKENRIFYEKQLYDLEYIQKNYLSKFKPLDKKVFEEFMEIHNIYKRYTITYPISLDGKEHFRWFINNRGGVLIKIEQTLDESPIKKPFLKPNAKKRGKNKKK